MKKNGENKAAFNGASRHKEDRNKQAEMDDHLGHLDRALKEGLSSTVAWLSQYAVKADRIGIDFKGGEVFKKFSDAGYKAGEYADEQFAKSIQTDKYIAGRFMIGDAMSFLQKGAEPNLSVVRNAEIFRSMPDKARTKTYNAPSGLR